MYGRRRGRVVPVMLGLVLLSGLLAACGRDDGTIESRPRASDDGDEPRSSDSRSATGKATGVGGLVLSQAGTPVVGALVVPVSRDEPPLAVPEMAVQTDDQGRYQWSLRPGAYDVTVTAAGHRPGTRPVVVTEGETASLDFELPPEE